MRLSVLNLCFLLLCGCGFTAIAEVSSPKLTQLSAEIAPYVLPAEQGERVIPQVNLSGVTMEQFVESTLSEYGIEAVVAASVKDRQINLRLRNLPVERVLEFVTQQINVKHICDQGRVIFFASEADLNDHYRELYAKKQEIAGRIRVERKRLLALKEVELKEEYGSIIVPEFKVDGWKLSRVFKAFSEGAISHPEVPYKFRVIPLMDMRQNNPECTFHFKDQSVAAILDELSKQHEFTWSSNEEGVIMVQRLAAP